MIRKTHRPSLGLWVFVVWGQIDVCIQISIWGTVRLLLSYGRQSACACPGRGSLAKVCQDLAQDLGGCALANGLAADVTKGKAP